MIKLTSAAFSLLLFATPALGEEPAKAPPPKWYDTVEIHGLVDAYYSGNFNQRQEDANPLRAFDGLNGFQLGFAKLTAQLAPTDAYTVGFRADLGFGEAASLLNGGTLSSGIGSVAVEQAYVSLKLPASLVLDAGKFVTNAGAEVIEAKDNWLYSRSLLFTWAIPFTHTGLRATVPVPGVEGLSAMAAVFNGFDNPPGPVGSRKAGHVALIYSGPSSTSVVLNAFYGYALPTDPDETVLLDGVIGRAFGDLSVNVNADFRRTNGLQLWGIAGMARYSLAGDKLRISARGEYLDNSDGLAAMGVGSNKVYEGTLGVSIPVGSNAEVRLEGRHDHLNEGTFASGSSGQTTGQVAVLAWF